MPTDLIIDHYGEKQGNNVKKFCYGIGTTLRWFEEYTQWDNLAERYVGLTK